MCVFYGPIVPESNKWLIDWLMRRKHKADALLSKCSWAPCSLIISQGYEIQVARLNVAWRPKRELYGSHSHNYCDSPAPSTLCRCGRSMNDDAVITCEHNSVTSFQQATSSPNTSVADSSSNFMDPRTRAPSVYTSWLISETNSLYMRGLLLTMVFLLCHSTPCMGHKNVPPNFCLYLR